MNTFVINIDDIPATDGAAYANELKETLLTANPDILVDVRQDDQGYLDFGGALTLNIAEDKALLVAQVMGEWLNSRKPATLSIETEARDMIAQNLTADDVEGIAKLLTKA